MGIEISLINKQEVFDLLENEDEYWVIPQEKELIDRLYKKIEDIKPILTISIKSN